MSFEYMLGGEYTVSGSWRVRGWISVEGLTFLLFQIPHFGLAHDRGSAQGMVRRPMGREG